MAEIFGVILLPLFMMALLFGMAGVRSDAIVKIFFDLLGAVIKGVFLMLGAVLRGIAESAIFLAMANRLGGGGRVSDYSAEQRPRRVKVTVVEDGED